jgi:hypothetical protein
VSGTFSPDTPLQLTAAAGEDGRPACEACPILLASVGGESSDAPAVCVEGAAGPVVAPARRISCLKHETRRPRSNGPGAHNTAVGSVGGRDSRQFK